MRMQEAKALGDYAYTVSSEPLLCSGAISTEILLYSPKLEFLGFRKPVVPSVIQISREDPDQIKLLKLKLFQMISFICYLR